MEKNPYEIDFEEYIRHTDASKKDKTLAWSTAIGLQQVDGLKPSSYLYETAKKNIEGEASFELKAALDYDFEMERNFKYKGLSTDEIIKHITFFVSRLWQIHAFGEGNTRTTAVFTIKYLRSMGYKVDNDIFAQNSRYFRNALVRANYKNLKEVIEENSVYLERFFRNLILGENNELKNRYTHIDYDEYVKKITQKSHESHSKVTVNLTEVQQNIITAIEQNQFVSQTEIANELSLARETVNRNMKKLQKQGIIKRVGADKNGHWEVIE